MSAINCAFQGTVHRLDLRTTKAGKCYLKMSARVGEQWVSVAYFADDAGAVGAELEEGANVGVKGKLTLNRWTNKDGAERSGLDVVADVVKPLGQQHPRVITTFDGRKRWSEDDRPWTPHRERQRRESAPSAAAEALARGGE